MLTRRFFLLGAGAMAAPAILPPDGLMRLRGILLPPSVLVKLYATDAWGNSVSREHFAPLPPPLLIGLHAKDDNGEYMIGFRRVWQIVEEELRREAAALTGQSVRSGWAWLNADDGGLIGQTVFGGGMTEQVLMRFPTPRWAASRLEETTGQHLTVLVAA